MTRINLNPAPEMLAKWGTLAYVSDGERQRILNLPFGDFKPAREGLVKQIKLLKKAKLDAENNQKFWEAKNAAKPK